MDGDSKERTMASIYVKDGGMLMGKCNATKSACFHLLQHQRGFRLPYKSVAIQTYYAACDE